MSGVFSWPKRSSTPHPNAITNCVRPRSFSAGRTQNYFREKNSFVNATKFFEWSVYKMISREKKFCKQCKIFWMECLQNDFSKHLPEFAPFPRERGYTRLKGEYSPSDGRTA
jgi:hypothetical protein